MDDAVHQCHDYEKSGVAAPDSQAEADYVTIAIELPLVTCLFVRTRPRTRRRSAYTSPGQAPQAQTQLIPTRRGGGSGSGCRSCRIRLSSAWRHSQVWTRAAGGDYCSCSYRLNVCPVARPCEITTSAGAFSPSCLDSRRKSQSVHSIMRAESTVVILSPSPVVYIFVPPNLLTWYRKTHCATSIDGRPGRDRACSV